MIHSSIKVASRGLALAALLALSSNAQAVLIADQSPGTAGVESGIPGTGVINADDFSVDAAYSINSISWWGYYEESFQGVGPGEPLPNDAFTVDLFDALDAPDFIGLSGAVESRAATEFVSAFGGQVYRYDFVLSNPLEIGPGTYYLSIVNEPVAEGPGFYDWLWGFDYSGHGTNWSYDPFGSWIEYSGEFDGGDFFWTVDADRIEAPVPVPEPGPLALLLSGLAAIGFRRLRK